MRATRFSGLVSDYFGRSGRRLIAALGLQIDAAIEAADVARAMAAGDVPAADAREDLATIKDRGDAERQRLVTALSSTLATPVDREDLFRMSRCVNDVLDNIRDFVRESHLYDLGPQPGVVPVLNAIADGLEGLRASTHELTHSSAGALDSFLSAKASVAQVRRCYQLELAEIFKGSTCEP